MFLIKRIFTFFAPKRTPALLRRGPETPLTVTVCSQWDPSNPPVLHSILKKAYEAKATAGKSFHSPVLVCKSSSWPILQEQEIY